MAVPQWTFVLTTIQGTVLGELTNAKDRVVTLPLNRLPTASFKLRLDHPLAGSLVDSSATCLLKAYRTDSAGARSLIFVGPVISADEVGDELTQSIACNAVGPFWYVIKRIIAAVPRGANIAGAGLLISGPLTGTPPAPTPTPSHTGVQTILSAANATYASAYTGVDYDVTSSTSTGVIYDIPTLKSGGEAIAELSVGAPFEYVVNPVEPVYGAGPLPSMGKLKVVDRIGQNRPEAIFEYGTARANVLNYQRTQTIESSLNAAVISVAGWPDAPGPHDLIKQYDATSIAAHGMIEDIVPDNNVQEDSLRTTLAQQHVLLRKNPRQMMMFAPARNAVPEPLKDYFVGDSVRARVVIAGQTRYDNSVRVWGITFSPDDEGNENVALELAQP